jgi:hypothetical protein
MDRVWVSGYQNEGKNPPVSGGPVCMAGLTAWRLLEHTESGKLEFVNIV